MIFESFESEDSELTTANAPLDSDPCDADALLEMELKGKLVWSQISGDQFNDKYGLDQENPGVAHFYMFTKQPRIDTFVFEAFASVKVTSRIKEELVFHPMFEKLIQRYTKSNAKPNPVLVETRSTDFCYCLTIMVEAMPCDQGGTKPALRLVREYSVLHHVWEKYYSELVANQSPPDLLVGIPMPFEFVNVVGHNEYDFGDVHGMWHHGLHGEEVALSKVIVPGTTSDMMGSTLSYLSREKLGPSVHYMMELLKSQRKIMTLSTALKIYDQLLCRLMVLHKYGVILGNLDPKFLNFGVRTAANVLYISRFDYALVAPTTHRSLGSYNERCASISAMRRREVHFVNDVESAFYVFLSLIFPTLPWDDNNSSQEFLSSSTSYATNHAAPMKPTAVEEKAKFWGSISCFNRMLRHVNYEISDSVYQGFTNDLLTTLYSKTQEAMAQCESIAHADYMSLVMTQSSPANNAYSNTRRVIATYFQFERVSSITKDPISQRKVDLLLKEDPVDKRSLWNLNDWCWTVFYPTYGTNARMTTVSMVF